MSAIIAIVVVCCVAFFIISTSIACFLHHRNIRKPIRGIVLREDGLDTVTGRLVDVDAVQQGDVSRSGAAVAAAVGASRSGDEPTSTSGAVVGRADAAGEGHIEDAAEVFEVFNLSEEEQRRREEHNRRINAEEARMAHPMRGDGRVHPLDGTPLAQLVNFFRELRSPPPPPDDVVANGGEEGEHATNPPAQHGSQAEGEGTHVNYGEYLVAVDITLHEPRSRQRRQTEQRKVREEDETTATEPYGGMTEHDWAALNDTSGIDYMNNNGTAYLRRESDNGNLSEDSRSHSP